MGEQWPGFTMALGGMEREGEDTCEIAWRTKTAT